MPPERRAVWAGTTARGGISTHVRVMQETPLWTQWRVRFIVTHREGSAAVRVVTFLRGLVLFLGEMVGSRPSVVHLHTASRGSFVRKGILVAICRVARVPVIMHVHASHLPVFYDRACRPVRAMIRLTLEQTDAVIALGDAWAGPLRTIAPGARITVISNAIHPAGRCRQPTPGEPVGVAFVGIVDDRKGTFVLLDAWRRLNFPDATLTVAGGGDVERARRYARDLGISETAQVLGWVPPSEVGRLLDRSQVLVLPSRREGQPMAVLEAMSRGLCVIASAVGGLPEMLRDERGLLVQPDRPDELATALAGVLTDPELRERYGAAAYQAVREQYDAESAWRRVAALYESVCR